MRILLVGPVPPELGSSNHGGVARHVWDLARALRQQGHDIEVLALGRYYHTTRQVDGIVVHGISFRVLQQLHRLVRKWAKFVGQAGTVWSWRDCIYILYTLLRLSPVVDESYDVIHAHGYGHKVPVACTLLHVAVPTILTIHSYHSAQFGSGDRQNKVRQYNAINRNTDALIHVSHADLEKGRDLGVDWSCPDFVVHNAIEVEKKKFPDTKRDGICFVGSLIRRKGLDLLIEAWKGCRVMGSLRIVGKGPLSKKIETEASKTSSIQIIGYLEKEEVLRQMRHSDALVVPSRSESFGLVYLEALLMGTPVVGYHKTLNEFISVLSPIEEELDYIHPYDASTQSIASLSEAIESAVAARRNDQGGRVAQGLIQKVRQHFSWNRIIPELESVYEQVTESHRVHVQEEHG